MLLQRTSQSGTWKAKNSKDILELMEVGAEDQELIVFKNGNSTINVYIGHDTQEPIRHTFPLLPIQNSSLVSVFIQLYLDRNFNTVVLDTSGFFMRLRSWDSSGIVVCSLFGRQLASISIIS